MRYPLIRPEPRAELEERLLFRRQFVMGPHFLDAFPSWRRLHVAGSLRLTAHPDLNVYQSVSGSKSITLLGYIVDPRAPDAGDAEIVDSLQRALVPGMAFGDFIRLTDPLGGRWVLIISDGKQMGLFTDACGYRQVFYTDTASSDVLWCGSQPGIIAEVMNLETDDDATAFIQTYEEGSHTSFWPSVDYFWPGDTSPYREIKHLVPNHYLDLRTGVSHRFWPSMAIGRLTVDDAVESNSFLLRELMASASKRFPLSLSITAGRDTRLLLAASRDVRDQLFYFTLTYWNQDESGPDVEVPALLLSRLGLIHHVIRCPLEMSPGFERIYRRNVTTARIAYGPIAEGLYTAYPQGRVCMKGNAIPIARARFRLNGMSRHEATAAGLAKNFAVEGHPFAIHAFDDWLNDARQASSVPIMDLFYWENIEGNWQAMSQTEWDIAQEVFAPYNCRALLANSLAVDEKYRRPPRYYLFERLMSRLWPDVLSVPINPHDPHGEQTTFRSHLRNVLLKTHLYGFVPNRLKKRQRNQ